MDTIVVKVSDLFSIASDLRKDRMDYVEVIINEGESDCDDPLPPSLNFTGFKKNDPEIGTDYDSAEAVPTDEFDPSFGVMHTNIH